MLLETAKVTAHVAVQGAFRLLELASPGIAALAQPGQFVHLRASGLASATLRRPFSIYKAGNGRLCLLYKIVGAGTDAMSRLSTGDEVSIMGPLGRGFPKPARGSFPILIGGGYGMAALYLLAERADARGLALAGGRGAQDILCEDEFRALGWELRVATEDGSKGCKGLVTEPLAAWLKNERAGLTPELFACGPMGMLQAVSAIAASAGCRAWISLDRPMGCGVGACLACVQRVRAETPQGWKWARICREGPVFDSTDILWQEPCAEKTKTR